MDIRVLNYFNYFTEIEDAFIRRRGKHLLLSPMDWALIESWKEMEIPLHVALRGIERAFDSWESKPRKRSVKSLLYCQEEVEAQHAEWLESRVGAAPESDQVAAQQNGQGMPFSKTAIIDHLRNGSSILSAALRERKRTGDDDFGDALERSVALLEDLEQDLAASVSVDAQKLEQSLTGVERMLSDAIGAVVDAKQLESLEAEVSEQLKPYRKQMEKSVYQQTFDNLLMKRLREQFGIPRLSLFYL